MRNASIKMMTGYSFGGENIYKICDQKGEKTKVQNVQRQIHEKTIFIHVFYGLYENYWRQMQQLLQL